MTTPYHSKYWANELTLRAAAGSIESLSRSIAGARVDLNPHQVDAALFALRSPLTKGVVLADEGGLGKTIEAGIVIAQRWIERRRHVPGGGNCDADVRGNHRCGWRHFQGQSRRCRKWIKH